MRHALDRIREAALSGLVRGPTVHIHTEGSGQVLSMQEHHARYRNLELRGRLSVSEYLSDGRGGNTAWEVAPLFHPPMPNDEQEM